MNVEKIHETDKERYAIYVDGVLVSAAEYKKGDGVISFNHTFTNPKYRGQGWAGQVVDMAIADVEENDIGKVVPMCWYVAEWFKKHPEKEGLLQEPLN
ncbi:MAG: N-acetyltransferase [Microbacteriaceae bacterium]|nr:N-acetyltransferase [Microbacteriaceae bacterium]